MKKVYAINGSPRRNQNTAALLDAALEGVLENNGKENVEVQRINLYELNYTGCKSCFACKRIGGPSYGKCALRDDLAPVLEKILQADGLLFGSPIYYRNITGQLHAFYERLLFPYTVYSTRNKDVQAKQIPCGFIYTMNVDQEEYLRDNYEQYIGLWERFVGGTFKTQPYRLCAYNTYQFNVYSKYVSDYFDEENKRNYKEMQFPKDLETAREMGRVLLKEKK